MPLPNLTPAEVGSLVPDAKQILPIGSGGQKLVFRGRIGEATYALKFALLPAAAVDDDSMSEVESRAAREIETMRDCTSPHMVKLGPIGLKTVQHGGQRLLYFSEEFIDGADLSKYLKDNGRMSSTEVCRLGVEIADAIRGLWDIGKVHRDIKPKNVMRRSGDGSFVLLDAGYAFDVVGESLSQGMLVGTLPYFPPERFDYGARRALVDFRSDMFSLGVTMYEMATALHPFLRPGDGSQHVFTRIIKHRPDAPSSINPDMPPELDRIILRMLGKSPHLRFRKIEQLVEALQAIGGN